MMEATWSRTASGNRAFQLQPAGLDLGQVENVVDDRQQVPAAPSILSSRSACSGVAPAP
jgi:hypothetical protein